MQEVLIRPAQAERPIAIIPVFSADLEARLKEAGASAETLAEFGGFKGAQGQTLLVPSNGQTDTVVLLGMEPGEDTAPFAIGAAIASLPARDYLLPENLEDAAGIILGFGLSAYSFDRYRQSATPRPRLAVPDEIDLDRLNTILSGVTLTRDLVNTPSNDLGPEELASAVADLFQRFGGTGKVIVGDDLLNENFPMVHAVGRASDRAPRLADFSWGDENAPKVTLVGKGVVFDTGGLDIKPASGMALMKKDMGGSANVLGLASMIMEAKLPVRLRVLVPCVENAISGNAFRPGDILKSRKGLTVEIGNTDAEGRLILADALALADEEAPDLLIDMATLTGAARVALGPDLPPFYTDDKELAEDIALMADAAADPLWRMPLWKPYLKYMTSPIADINHINTSGTGFAGSVTAALFLSRFVENAKSWAHFDIYAWNPSDKPGKPSGGEAQGIRCLFDLISERYAGKM
ncbi:leucyl aminopeptidase family protein [Roseibium sediminis]|uniref:leucyl aminopeptidase family protein n=1 Tax=Roseibium sediminis TaxID=1775174 RepID=UPI00123C9D66|nr:leucyl aminopeptidase family protein [Roseibium sediminis]